MHPRALQCSESLSPRPCAYALHGYRDHARNFFHVFRVLHAFMSYTHENVQQDVAEEQYIAGIYQKVHSVLR